MYAVINEDESPVEPDGLDGVGRQLIDGVPQLMVLAKTISILDAFSLVAPELSIRELTAHTGLPTSTCVRIVRNMVHFGLLERADDRYRIGLSIVRWAGLGLAGRDLVTVSREPLRRLRDNTGESALLSVRDGKYAVVVAVANSRHSIVRQLKVGEVSPLNAGSSGKIFLAFDPDAFELIRRGELEARTSHTVINRKQLRQEIEKVRLNGYSESFEERNEGAAGLAAPVLDNEGGLAGAVGLSGPMSRLSPENIERYSEQVIQAAHDIATGLGRSFGFE
jgi:DNA-binding IclR family transcriptional regulator